MDAGSFNILSKRNSHYILGNNMKLNIKRYIKQTLKKNAAICFIALAISPLFANPLTGNKKSPVPVYQAKPSEAILQGQRFLNNKLGDYIASWKEHKSMSVLFSILGISFLYGLIHAAGPGHRKTVVFSFYLTRAAKPIEPFLTGLALAAAHGGAAGLLMLIFKGVSGAISVKTNNAAIYMEGISFFVLIILSIYGIIDAILELKIKKPNGTKPLKLGAILLSGIYPCPAAMLVLILSVSLDVAGLGFWAVTALSLGMSVPIIASAYLAWAGRTGLFFKLKNKERAAALTGAIFQIIGYAFLLFFSIKTALPFIMGLIAIAKN